MVNIAVFTLNEEANTKFDITDIEKFLDTLINTNEPKIIIMGVQESRGGALKHVAEILQSRKFIFKNESEYSRQSKTWWHRSSLTKSVYLYVFVKEDSKSKVDKIQIERCHTECGFDNIFSQFKGANFLSMTVNGQTFLVVNTHLFYSSSSLNPRARDDSGLTERKKQFLLCVMKSLQWWRDLHKLDQSSYPDCSIFMGDLNFRMKRCPPDRIVIGNKQDCKQTLTTFQNSVKGGQPEEIIRDTLNGFMNVYTRENDQINYVRQYMQQKKKSSDAQYINDLLNSMPHVPFLTCKWDKSGSVVQYNDHFPSPDKIRSFNSSIGITYGGFKLSKKKSPRLPSNCDKILYRGNNLDRVKDFICKFRGTDHLLLGSIFQVPDTQLSLTDESVMDNNGND